MMPFVFRFQSGSERYSDFVVWLEMRMEEKHREKEKQSIAEL